MPQQLLLQEAVALVHLVEAAGLVGQEAIVAAMRRREALLEADDQRIVELHLRRIEAALCVEMRSQEAVGQAIPEPPPSPAGVRLGAPELVDARRVGRRARRGRLGRLALLAHGRSHSTRPHGSPPPPPEIRRSGSRSSRVRPWPLCGRAIQSLVPDIKDHPALETLRRRLAEEEDAYSVALAELDRLARLDLPETGTDLHQALLELNGAASARTGPPSGGGWLGAALARPLLEAVGPVLERQQRFEAALVRFLNDQVDRQARLEVALRELAAGLVRYAQRVEPVVDARDEVRVSEAPSDVQLLLEAFERRLAAVQTRGEALLALRDRIEVLSEEMRALRGSLQAVAAAPEPARRAARAAADAAYTAFENRFRGDRAAIRARQADYVELLRDQAPVLDLGCGRGEFLDLLREAGIAARGVESNANAVRECQARGLEVAEDDLVEAMRSEGAGTLGGVFAAQVAEHLAPPVLSALLAEAHRALRPGGVLILETVNAACGLAFLDVFIRDLTHERPLHPETLRFLVAAAGFLEARVEWRSPVPDEVRLRLLPSGSLPPPVIQILNENAERLNALLFAPLDYAIVARR